MSNSDGTVWVSFNGEIYNYLELRQELSGYPFVTRTDTEVILAAYQRWGEGCLDRFVGMFSFLIWDERSQCVFGARDRFGVKPFYYHMRQDGTLFVASEINALHAAGVPGDPDAESWASYLTYGAYDHSAATFWKDVKALPAGHRLSWKGGQLKIECWYDIAERVGGDFDERSAETVQEEYRSLLAESVRLRMRSDVRVGINLSGGLDSSVLLGVVQNIQSLGSEVRAYTFVTGDPNYDELPWVRQMLAQTRNPCTVCELKPEVVPDLAESVQQSQGEPFGGIPTLAYARLFEVARSEGTIVLLDGQGLDEQWAGYDYYSLAVNGAAGSAPVVQGSKDRAVRPECLTPEFRSLAQAVSPAEPFPDALRNLQYRDIRYTKIPRALRFNDRISMRSSTELREPFLDHRLAELALRQRPTYKIANGTQKWLLRQMAATVVPPGLAESPKRAVQTPQREWLRGPLRDWANLSIERALTSSGGSWLDSSTVRAEWQRFYSGEGDNSFYVWQWISLGMMLRTRGTAV
jgi:asparagine synthase (glutamine-hydrolysing)